MAKKQSSHDRFKQQVSNSEKQSPGVLEFKKNMRKPKGTNSTVQSPRQPNTMQQQVPKLKVKNPLNTVTNPSANSAVQPINS